MRVLLVLSLCVTYTLAEEVLKVSARDSYLDAYHETKGDTKVSKAEKKSDDIFPVYSGPGDHFESSGSFGPPSHQYGPPNSQYGPPNSQYGPPTPQYGYPQSQYGPPSHHYGPPPSYGSFAEPVPQYGPPAYGPPAQNLQVFYGVPHAMISIWDKLWEKIKWKLDLFTFGKILLKLVIFKKIVSLIAILCLLLFIPSLKHKKGLFGSSSDETERGFQTKTHVDDALNNLSSFVSGAIDNYMTLNKQDPASCNSTYCRTQNVLNQIEKKTSYTKLAEFYVKDNEN